LVFSTPNRRSEPILTVSDGTRICPRFCVKNVFFGWARPRWRPR